MPKINDLRDLLFAEMQACPPGTVLSDADIRRIEMKCALADRIIDTARVEVQLSLAMKGAIDVPFIEQQSQERPAAPPAVAHAAPAPQQPLQSVAKLLSAGPAPDHPWRKSAKERSAA